MHPRIPALDRAAKPPQFSLKSLLLVMAAMSLMGLLVPELRRMTTSSNPRDVAVVLLMLCILVLSALAYVFSRMRPLFSGMIVGYSLLLLAMFWFPRLGQLRQISDRLGSTSAVPATIDYPLLMGFYGSMAWLGGAALGWTIAATTRGAER